MIKRVLSLFILLGMVTSMLLETAFAEETVFEAFTEQTLDAENVMEPFMEEPVGKESSHEHAYVAYVTSPTCTEDGYTTYICSCGESYVSDYTDALNHSQTVDVSEIPATCTTSGVTAGKQCLLCGQITEGCQIIPATGHVPQNVAAIPATETSMGTATGSVCAVCGEILSGCEQIQTITPAVSSAPTSDTVSVSQNTALQAPVTILFDIIPANAIVSVYSKNYLGEKTEYNPEPDGAYILMPGQYYYTLSAEGYVAIEDTLFTVAESFEPLLISTIMTVIDGSAASAVQIFQDEEELSADVESETAPAEKKNEGADNTLDSGTCGANDNNLTWVLTNDGILKISGTGAMKNFGGDIPWDSYRESIRKVILDEGITSIGSGAFISCNNLIEVSIPSTVTSIGSSSFDYCRSLTSITIPEGVTSIGGFSGCTSLTNLTIPSTVVSIPNYAFSSSGLVSITIPNGVVEIGEFAFMACKNLTDLSISNSVTTIKLGAFQGCASLTSVTVPGSVTNIGPRAFCDCSNLKSITFQGNMPTIGGNAFAEVTPTITYTDNGSFNGDNMLDYGGTIIWTSTSGAVRVSGTCVNYACNLTWVLENGVLTIIGSGPMTDYGPTTDEAAPWYAYQDSIIQVVINNGVTDIGDRAFSFLRNMTSVSIPSSVTAIGEAAFFSCESLAGIIIPTGVTAIGWGAFHGSGLLSVTIPDSVTSLGDEVFCWCESLKNITFSSKLDCIPLGTCDQCRSLTDVTIPTSVKTIENTAFRWCDKLTNIIIPDGVTSIGEEAFCKASALASITIPNSLTNILSGAFRDANAMKDVYYRGTKAVWDAIQIEDYNEPLASATIHYAELDKPVLIGISNESGGVKVTWNTVEGAVKYRVFRKTGDKNWIKIADVTGSNYTDGGVTGGTKYTYTVRCVSEDGNTYTSGYDTAGKTITYNIAAPELSSVNGVNSGVEIKWVKSTGAAKYRVFRKGPGDTKWQKLGDTTAISYLDKTAKAGTTYSYTVRCISSDGKTYTSGNDKTGKTIKYVSIPVLSSTANVYGGVKITWKKATGAEKYRVFRKTGSGSWIKLGDTTGISWTDKTAKSGTKYVYTVRSVSSDGKYYTGGYDSAGKTRTYIAAPVISSLTTVSGGVKIVWGKVTGAAKYRVFRKGPSDTEWKRLGDTTGTFYTDKTAKGGTKYSYTVRCLSKDGNNFTSGYSGTGKSISVPYSQSNPAITSLTGENSGIKVTWGKVNGAEKYRVFRKDSGNTNWQKAGDTTSTSYMDESVRAKTGKTYSYTVRCISSDGKIYTSGYDSNGKSIYYAPAPEIAGTLNSNGIQVTWKAVSNVTKYRLYRKLGTSGSWAVVKDVTGIVYTDTDVSPNKSYTYTVRCLSSSNTLISGYDTTGKSGKATLPIVPPPALISVENVVEGGKIGIRINWTKVDGAVQYRVYRQTDNSDFFAELKPTKDTSYIDQNVSSGVKYTYAVRCQNSDAINVSYSSNSLSIVGTGQNTALTLTSANNVATGVRISWNPVSGASQYRVVKGSPNSSGEISWYTIPSSVQGITYLDEQVNDGTNYSYYVYAVNSSGSKIGSNSNTLSITYQYAVSMPTITGISVKDGKVTITWNAVAGIEKYRVFRKTGNGMFSGIDFATGTSYTSAKLSSGTYTYSIGCINSLNNDVSEHNQTGKTITVP